MNRLFFFRIRFPFHLQILTDDIQSVKVLTETKVGVLIDSIYSNNSRRGKQHTLLNRSIIPISSSKFGFIRTRKEDTKWWKLNPYIGQESVHNFLLINIYQVDYYSFCPLHCCKNLQRTLHNFQSS